MKKKLLESLEEHLKPKEPLPVEYIIKSSVKSIENKKVLFLSLFGQGKKEREKANFKVFIWDRKYISQILEDDGSYKWSGARLDNLTGGLYYNSSNTRAMCETLGEKENIEEFLETKCEKSGYEYESVVNFQKEIMQERLNAKHKRIKDRIDGVMVKVPNLPKGFDDWVYNGPFNHSRYNYYKRKGKDIEVFCTECKNEFAITETKDTKIKVKHNNTGNCVKCNKNIIYKAVGKSTRVVDWSDFAIVQNFEDGLIVRYFSGSKSYNRDYKTPKLSYSENFRQVYTFEDGNLSIERYEHGFFLQTGEVRWCDDSGRQNTPKVYLYTRNIQRVLKRSKWQYSCLYEFSKAVEELYVHKFLVEYLKHPQIEYLIKFKLYNFIDEHLSSYHSVYWTGVNFEGKTIKDVLGIDKILFLQMQRLNLSASGLSFIKEAATILDKSNGLTDSQVKWVMGNVSPGQYCRMLEHSTPHKIIKYIEQQSSEKYIKRDVLADWGDYIRQCKELRFDILNSFVLYPKNLQERHDELTIMQKSEGLTKYDKKVKEAFQNLDGYYSYSDKKLIIRPAKCVNEIIAEGHKLRHCVGMSHYISGVAKGDMAIMVIRKTANPDDPFFTLELNLKTMSVSQCRGYKNCSMTDEIKGFVERWKERKLPERLKKAVG